MLTGSAICDDGAVPYGEASVDESQRMLAFTRHLTKVLPGN